MSDESYVHLWIYRYVFIRKKVFYWFRKMTVVGSSPGSMTSPAMVIWLSLLYRHGLCHGLIEQDLSTVRQLLITHKIKLPLLHHKRYVSGPLIL